MSDLKVGQLVFRVAMGYASNGIDVGIMTRQIAHVTAQMLRLDKPFPFTAQTAGRIMIDRTLGRVFFLTAKEALHAFDRDQAGEMTRAAARIENARVWRIQLRQLAITHAEAPELLERKP